MRGLRRTDKKEKMKKNSAKITKMIKKIARSNTTTAQGRGIKTATRI